MTTLHSALTPYTGELRASGIREIFDLAAGRDDILHLEVGQPDFPTPAHVIDAAFAAARRGSGYTQTAGTLELRDAICTRLRRVHGLDYGTEGVLVTQGAVQAVAIAAEALLTPGDEVLLPDPAWPNYEIAIIGRGARVRCYPLREADGFLPDPDEVENLITERTKLLVLNSPGNPTGTVIPPERIEAIVDVARRRGVLVLADEVYDEMVFDGRTPDTAARFDPEIVIGVWSFSKTYAMTGWRIGYLAAPAPLVRAFTLLQEGMISCVSSFVQAAATAALDGPQDIVGEMRAAYERRRDIVLKLLREAGIDPVVPGGAFYLMLPLDEGADGRRAALDLVANHGVACAPGTAFGTVAADTLRLSLASSEDTLRDAVDRIVRWHGVTSGGTAL